MIPFTQGNMLKGKDVQDGDRVKILSDGEWREFKYKEETTNSLIIKVEYKGKETEMKVTKASYNSLSPAYGVDMKDWIGKEAILMTSPLEKGISIIMKPVKSTSTKPTKAEEVIWNE